MTDERPRRLSESIRVEAFSDGVFSIAITLLVLELAVPAVRGEFAKQLATEWVSYLAYLAAFGSIGVLWMGHHTVFSKIRAVDSGLLWRNLVLLLTVSVVPFPTAVIASAFRTGNGTDQAAAVVSYAIVGMASGVAWLLLFSYLQRAPQAGRSGLGSQILPTRRTPPDHRRVRDLRADRLDPQPPGCSRHLPRVPGPLRAPGSQRQRLVS
jgi:uncharacterized membrane protein